MSNAEKNFKRYARQLRLLLLACKADMYFGMEDLAKIGIFVPDEEGTKIVIGEQLVSRSWRYALVTLLHETGHLLTVVCGTVYVNPVNTKMNECLAWVFAEALLEDLKWPITREHFVRSRRRALKSYGIRGLR